ncbi:hypothetical protein [Methylobacterium sp. J-076]|uniref:hypothetical protein n=1 Tax=Methylobacterium sp. J-076 TaxID=2836655 RepID=UPI001FB89FC8|nr:hypothetical protein [Methylobacterium sp. J-076]
MAVAQARPKFIGAVSVAAGVPPLRSTTVARLDDTNPSPLVKLLPPTWRILPVSYSTAVEAGPVFGASPAPLAFRGGSRKAMAVIAPLPVGSRYHILSELMPNTLPFGATQARGYQKRLLSGPKASRLLAPNRLIHLVPS